MPGGLQSLMKFPVIFYFNVEILHLFLKATPKGKYNLGPCPVFASLC